MNAHVCFYKAKQILMQGIKSRRGNVLDFQLDARGPVPRVQLGGEDDIVERVGNLREEAALTEPD
jgi:hypothetical protein